MTAYEAYQCFLALKQHFTTPSYDFFKYNGKVRTSVDSFEKRKDAYCFRKLASLPDPKGRILACMLADITWINDVVSTKGAKAETDYQKIIQAFSHAFKTFLDAFKPDVVALVGSSRENDYPRLAELLIEGKIPIQFVIALDNMLRFLPTWNKNFEPILWKPYVDKIEKYRPFFTYDEAKIKSIFLAWAQQNR
jgi:hypothetical protein